MKIDKLTVPYAQVPNELLCDKKISFKAKGLWAYIQSKPNDYDFSSHRIVDETNDGLDSVKTALAELEQGGYLIRKRLQSGRVDYCLTFPKVENPTGGKSPRGKIHPVSKNNLNNTNKDNIVIITSESENPTGVETAPAHQTEEFFSMVKENAEAFQIFVSNMAEKTKFPPAMVSEELRHFTIHWTEKTQNGKKERWQTEKTFEVRRRLVTWFNNKKTNFGKNKVGANGAVENKYQVTFTK